MTRAPGTVLLEENVVEGLGKFTAYSNGHVRVMYEDRTCVDLVADLSARMGAGWQVSCIC